MSYLALYRRYRPDTFDKLIGQEHIVKTLKNQIENNRVGHAYLFTGARGTGKTSCAKIFAKAINCLSPVNASPCGKCESCIALKSPSNIDVIEIDAASNNGVNEIRELRDSVQYPPVTCSYKVYIIDEVHMLTGAAFNALLKTLEEPPSHAVFILATTEVHKIPQTILSRCMRFDFRLIPVEKIESLIKSIYDELGKKYTADAVKAIATAGEGSIRDALSIADTALSFSEGELTYSDVMSILGASDFDSTVALVKSICMGETGEVIQKLDSLSENGKSYGVMLKDICSFVRDLIVVKTCSDYDKILALPQERIEELKKTAELCQCERLLRILEIFSDAEGTLRYTNHPRIVFETASIKACRPQADYNIDALLSRITELEKELKEIKASGVKIEKAIKEEPNEVKRQAESVKVVQVEEKEEIKKSIGEENADAIKGEILYGLRSAGKEMLWIVMQNVGVSVSGNVLTLVTSNGDDRIVGTTDNINAIKETLKKYQAFEISVNVSSADKNKDKLQTASEKIKAIYGDDIVIIND